MLKNKVSFEAATGEDDAGNRVVVVDMTKRRPWKVPIRISFIPDGGDRSVYDVKTVMENREKQFQIQSSALQTGEFIMQVYSSGPFKFIERLEGEVQIP